VLGGIGVETCRDMVNMSTHVHAKLNKPEPESEVIDHQKGHVGKSKFKHRQS
jgi:hypothetical protein